MKGKEGRKGRRKMGCWRKLGREKRREGKRGEERREGEKFRGERKEENGRGGRREEKGRGVRENQKETDDGKERMGRERE